MQNISYINIERSLNELGTDIYKLKPNSCKLIYRICAICKKEEIKIFRIVTVAGQVKCLNCSNKINGNTNIQIRAEKIKENFKKNGHPRLGIPHTEETKQKIRNNRKPHIWTEEERAEWSKKFSGENASFYGKKHTPETLAKMSAIQKIVARKGKDCNLYGKCYYAKHINYTTKNGSIVKMKSGWEVKVAKYLDDNNIPWEYEKQTFPIIYTYEGQTKDGTYTPDFFLTNEIWEIKGYWRKDAQIKYEAFKLQYPDIKITLLMKKELKELGIKL